MAYPDPTPGSEDDPTLIRNQPALRVGRRRWWYLWAGLFALVSVGVLAWLSLRQPLTAIVGIAIVVALFVAMLIAGALTPTRTRNLAFAWLLIAMAITTLVCVLIITAAETGSGYAGMAAHGSPVWPVGVVPPNPVTKPGAA